MFRFHGDILPSKSWLNRAQVIQYFNPALRLEAVSEADDVVALREAITALRALPATAGAGEFDLGLGGTSFRFFTFLISRRPGRWRVRAHPRLLERPQGEVPELLSLLGVRAELRADGLMLESSGWRVPAVMEISAAVSSQFVSGLLLSCWGLESELRLRLRQPVVSRAYLEMTLALLRDCGLHLAQAENEKFLELVIPPHQSGRAGDLRSEPDVSSAFALAAAAAVNGDVTVTNWRADSRQPDMAFLPLFRRMGITCDESPAGLTVRAQSVWRGVRADLGNAPDLFPVLAALCALAEGESLLEGAEQLRHKESDRIAKTRELLDLCGLRCEARTDGLWIAGRGRPAAASTATPEIIFDPAHDHRMAMAAAVLKLAGFPLRILHPEVVNKSYPAFWRDTGVKP